MHVLVTSLFILIALVAILLMHTGKQNFCRQKSKFSLPAEVGNCVSDLTSIS